jgi:plasmid stability protein
VRLCYRENVKNVTVSLPDDVYRAARVRAAEGDRSLSALVAAYLRSLAGGEAEFSRLEAQQSKVLDEIDRFRGGDRLGREQLHQRGAGDATRS